MCRPSRDAAGRTSGYDGENRQISFNGAASYGYDGDGRRVKKVDGTGTTVFVYNAAGQLVAEYTSGTPQGSGTSYLTSDHLGSTRVVAKADGTVKARYDYLPFGEEIPSNVGGRGSIAGYGGVDSTRQKFTSKDRENESGLDYFITRYYAGAQGRFTSPDSYNIIFEKEKGRDENERRQFLLNYISQPQVWNKYVYTLNNPLKYTDPDGRRELTEEDKRRLDRLLDEYNNAKNAGDTQLANSIGDAIREIAEAIDAVPEGQEDPDNLQAVFFAIDNLGNTNYGFNGTVSNGVTVTVGSGDWKCNIFCANAYAIGAGVGFGGKGVPTNSTFIGGILGRKYPPVANDFANTSKAILNFEVVNSPGLGDVVAFPNPRGLGHSAREQYPFVAIF